MVKSEVPIDLDRGSFMTLRTCFLAPGGKRKHSKPRDPASVEEALDAHVFMSKKKERANLV